MHPTRLALIALTAIAFAGATAGPSLAERNTGISASLGKAMAATASAFCDGVNAWADSAQDGLVPTAGGLKPSLIPRSDKKGSDDRAAAQTIRDTGRSMGCPI